MKKALLTKGVFALLLLGIGGMAWLWKGGVWRPTPETALQQFYTPGKDAAEDMLMDPLILAGEPIVPLVIAEIQNKNMPNRRYAIGFLGNGSYCQALPVLEKILNDPSELDYVRADSLEAVYLIDAQLGTSRAAALKNESALLGATAQEIINGKGLRPERRTYFDALLGRHD